MSIRFLVIDGFNLIRRIYEARIPKKKHESESGDVSAEDMKQVIEATKTSLARALKAHQPTHAAMVMEQHGKTWRDLLYSGIQGESVRNTTYASEQASRV